MKTVTYIVSDINKAIFFEHSAHMLRQNGYELSFILINSKNGELDNFLQKNEITVHHISVNSLLFSWKQILQCKRILKSLKPNIIHCHAAKANWVGLWGAYL